MEHHPAKAGEAAAAAGGEHLVGIAAAAVQGKEIHGAQAVPVVLLAEHIAVYAENAHIAGARFTYTTDSSRI